MNWENAGVALPPKWKKAISAHNKKMLGKRGLGRYAWCVATEVLLCIPPDKLLELASNLRKQAEIDPDTFAKKWSNPEKTARTVAPELRAAINEALKATTQKKQKKS
ncbi:MAG: hypothetical protein MI923_30330 [Phycisphaerales bacterium]|nr:hypothetical protein [Phycisphaerales bacterium]